jgi:hypothetical protein
MACPRLQHFFTWSHIQHDFRRKKKLLNINCVLIFCTTFVWNISYCKWNWIRYDHKSAQVFVWSARYLYQLLTSVEFSGQIFAKSSSFKFYENLSSWSWVLPCGRTDTKKQTSLLRNVTQSLGWVVRKYLGNGSGNGEMTQLMIWYIC